MGDSSKSSLPNGSAVIAETRKEVSIIANQAKEGELLCFFYSTLRVCLWVRS